MKETTRNWVEFTKRDLLAAEKLQDEEYLQNVVLFHCQQAVEKVFKAILEEHNIRIPRIHSVFSLYEQLPDNIKHRLQCNSDDLERIDEIYIDSRYPPDIGLLPGGFPTDDETQELFDIAKRIIDACLEMLNNTQNDTDKSGDEECEESKD